MLVVSVLTPIFLRNGVRGGARLKSPRADGVSKRVRLVCKVDPDLGSMRFVERTSHRIESQCAMHVKGS